MDFDTRMLILAAANIPVYILLGWLLFNDLASFLSSAKYLFIPDIISFVRGEGEEDSWESLKVFFFVAACIAVVVAEYWFLEEWFWKKP